jgi:tRNA G18 (ribose-2'-O)-methylase SpoU
MTIQEQANNDVSRGYSEHNVHDFAKPLTVEQRKELCEITSLPYDVMVLNVTGELNVGNIVRSSSLCGARKVHILGRRKYDSRGEVGTNKYIDVARVSALTKNDELCLDTIEQYLYDNNLYPIFVEQHDNSVTLENYEYIPRKDMFPCVIFGNEGRGIPTDLMNRLDCDIIQLNQRGVIRSFNVGSAASIVLYRFQTLFG